MIRRLVVAWAVVAAVVAVRTVVSVLLGGERADADDVVWQFRLDWETARAELTPTIAARVEFPDGELYVVGRRVVARTRWTGFEFVTEADAGLLAKASPALRVDVAVHEVCHLLDAERLRDGTPLLPDERRRLELRAEHCVVAYLATREAVGP